MEHKENKTPKIIAIIIIISLIQILILWFLKISALTITIWQIIYFTLVTITWLMYTRFNTQKQLEKIKKDPLHLLSTEEAREFLENKAKENGIVVERIKDFDLMIIQPGLGEDKKPSTFYYMSIIDRLDHENKLIYINLKTLQWGLSRTPFTFTKEEVKQKLENASESIKEYVFRNTSYFDPTRGGMVYESVPTPVRSQLPQKKTEPTLGE